MNPDQRHRSTGFAAVGVAFVFMALGCLQAFLVSGRQQPIIKCDEFDYLMQARFFAGFDCGGCLKDEPHYTFGSALFMAPAFWLLDRAESAYQAVLLGNGLAASLIVVFAYALARLLDGGARPGVSVLAALAVAVYPTHLLYSSMAWPEPLLTSLYWLSVLLSSMLPRPGARDRLYALFGLLLGLLYAVHHRSLGAVTGGAAVVGLLWWRGRCSSRALLACLACAGLGLLAAAWVDAGLIQSLWQDQDRPLIPPSGARALMSPRGAPLLAATALGHLFYLGSASCLFYFVGMGHATRLVQARPEQPQGVAALYVLLSSAAVFALAVFKSAVEHVVDGSTSHLVDGRYNEAFAGPLLLIGILAPRRGHGRAFLAAAGLVVYSACALQFLAHDALSRPLGQPINVTGLFLYRTDSWGLDLFPALAGALGGAVLVHLLWARWRKAGLCVLAALFLITAALNYHGQIAPAVRAVQDEGNITAWIRQHAASSKLAFWKYGEPAAVLMRCHYSLLLPGYKLEAVRDPAEVEASGAPYLIVPGLELPGGLPPGRLAALDAGKGCSLWVISEQEQARLSGRQDAFLPPLEPLAAPQQELAPLPPEACRSSLSVLGSPALDLDSGLGAGLRAWFGKDRPLRVRLVHRGSGSAWPASVRLGVIWLPASGAGARLGEQRVELPLRLAPGRGFQLDVPLRPLDYEGRPLPAGPYQVWIGLVQDGVRWFYQEGDEVLKLAVSVKG